MYEREFPVGSEITFPMHGTTVRARIVANDGDLCEYEIVVSTVLLDFTHGGFALSMVNELGIAVAPPVSEDPPEVDFVPAP